MNILVACEESQRVCTAFREKGHNAFSCDLIPCSGGHPEWHIMQDVIPLLNGRCTFKTCDGTEHEIVGRWDMIIAFPPCTHLAVSGARHFEKKRADGRQREGIEFFCQFLTADCERIAIENPVGIISGNYIPNHFSDLAEKYGLPKKNHTDHSAVRVWRPRTEVNLSMAERTPRADPDRRGGLRGDSRQGV